MDNNYLMSTVMTVKEVGELLHISRKYVYDFIRINNIKYRQIGKKFYILRESIEQFLAMED